MKKLVIALAAIGFATPVMAQTATQTTPMTTGQVSTPQFVKMVTISDMFEIQSSRLAEQKSKNQDVQKFAKQMVTDHGKTSSQLKSLLKQDRSLKVKQPTELDQQHSNMLKQLKSASSAQFDQSYKKMQVDAHQKAVDLFQSYSQSGDDSALKKWAANTLPKLQEHLQMAEGLPEVTGKM
jgi:putative membrane protein